MLKKTVLVIAIMALVLGSLLAQPKRVQANDDLDYSRKGMMRNNSNMRGDDNHQQARRGMGDCNNDQRGNHQMKGMEPGSMILAMSEELELTTAQIQNIKDLQINFKKQQNTKHAELENLQIDKREAMQDQNFKQATKITKSIASIKEQIELSKITMMENIHKELTTTQIEKMKTLCKPKMKTKK